MDYESFKEKFVEDLKDRFDEQGADVKVSVNTVNKLNESYEAVTVTPEGSKYRKEILTMKRKTTVKAEARKLRKQFLRYKEAEIVYSIQHKKLLELADKAGSKEIVDGIVDLILETVISKKDSVLVSGQEYPAALVKSKFLKLNYSHIEYVIGCMGKNTTKVRNIKAYLMAALFNAGSTMGSYYKAEVNHDLPQFAG